MTVQELIEMLQQTRGKCTVRMIIPVSKNCDMVYTENICLSFDDKGDVVFYEQGD